MDFFSNILKNTVNKVETLSKTATEAVGKRSSTNSPEEKSPEEQPSSSIEFATETPAVDSSTGLFKNIYFLNSKLLI